MNNRLIQFLSAENISQSQLADKIGVARASISHIIAGRNKPGFDFIESMISNFPALNIEWLISGNGKMYKTSARNEPESGNLFEAEDSGLKPDTTPAPLANNAATSEIKTLVKENNNSETKRIITKITVFYSDNTFEEIQ